MIRSGPHAEAVADELPLGDLPFPLDVGGPRLETDDVLLLHLELSRVLDRDDPLVGGDEARQHVEKRRLAAARAAGDQDVEPRFHDALDELPDLRDEGLQGQQVVELQRVDGEAPDGQGGAVHRDRRDDGVDARPVGEPGIHHGRGLVDPAPHGRDDPVDDLLQVVVILEARPGELDLPEALHVDMAVAVDQDVRDRRVVHERLDRPQSEDLVEDLLVELLALLVVERRRERLLGEDPVRESPDLLLEQMLVQGIDEGEVQHVHETIVDLAFQLVVFVRDQEHHRFLFGKSSHQHNLSFFSRLLTVYMQPDNNIASKESSPRRRGSTPQIDSWSSQECHLSTVSSPGMPVFPFPALPICPCPPGPPLCS